MPAPATSSRHLYTGHRRGHIQAAPRLRTHRGEPLSQDHPQIPVSMPSLFRFDASAVVHTCSSSHRTPAPLTARRQPQRSPPRLLTDAACGGSQSPPARRPPQDPPPSLAQHGSCRRSSTSSSLPFRTHVGAGNSAVGVDLPRCGPTLSPRVPHHVPIPGPRMERETPGQRPRPNYGHPQAASQFPVRPFRAVPYLVGRPWRGSVGAGCSRKQALSRVNSVVRWVSSGHDSQPCAAPDLLTPRATSAWSAAEPPRSGKYQHASANRHIPIPKSTMPAIRHPLVGSVGSGDAIRPAERVRSNSDSDGKLSPRRRPRFGRLPHLFHGALPARTPPCLRGSITVPRRPVVPTLNHPAPHVYAKARQQAAEASPGVNP